MIFTFRNRGIAFKLAFFILTSSSIIFALIFSYNYGVYRGMIIEKIEDVARNLISGVASKIETTLLPVEKVTRQLGLILGESSPSKEELENMLLSMIKENPEIYGSTIAFEPYALEKDSYYYAPYFYRKGEEITFADLGTDSYAYFNWDWYKVPKKLDRPVWSEPYYDRGGGDILMVTYSVPFYREVGGEKKFTGIVTADISLSDLKQLVSSIRVGKTGYGFLVSKKGKMITHPDKSLIMNKSFFDITGTIGGAELQKVGEEMAEGKIGFVAVKDATTRRKIWIAYAPITTTGWSLAVVFPKGELMASLYKLNREVFTLGFLGIIFLAVVIILFSSSITRPLRVLALKVRDIARGNLEFELPSVKSGDEVGTLTEALKYMKTELVSYIKKLTKTTAEKERIESELKIASGIQLGILPKVAPPFTDRDEFDIYAAMKPAKEVGGDFYDFYFIDDKHLCFVIGDVAGKGVPAAIFMAIVKTFIKSAAVVIKDPKGIFYRINRELARDNDSAMFVTVFCGILNIETGEILYSNAGHNRPLVIRKGKEEPEFLEGGASIVLGAFEDVFFEEERLVLDPGDALYMYTDGVTEAVNTDGELFSDERLKAQMSLHKDDPTKKLGEIIFKDIEYYSEGMPQADDITVLVLRYLENGRNPGGSGGEGRRFVIKNDPSEVRRILEALAEFGRENGFSDGSIKDVALAVDELVHNIIAYGFPDSAEHEIDIRMKMENGKLFVEITDDGKPFNPLEAPVPDVSKPLIEREEGGLGIHLARNLVDDLAYKRENDRNILTLKKNKNK